MVNLIATIPGARKDRIVIAGHYDTKLFREFRFVGASDGGSSAAFLIELARVLKARRNALTIELLFLDGEEARLSEWQGTDNTYGSRHYVEAARTRRLARHAEGAGAGRHDRRPRSADQARHQLHAVADRHDLGRGQAARSWTTTSCAEPTRDRRRPPAVPRGRRAVRRHHRPRLPSLAHASDTLDAVSARSLQVVGDVVLAALPQIEARFSKG